MNKGYYYALLSVLFFMFVPIFTRALLPAINAEAMLFFRFLFASITLLIISKIIRKPLFEKITRKYLFFYAIFGIIYALVLYTYIVAVSYTYIANVQFLQQMSPIFTFIFARLFLKETVKKSLYYSLIIAIIGAFIILYFSNTSVVFEMQSTGNVIAFTSGVLLAVYTVISRYMAKSHSLMQANTWAFIFGTLLMSFSLINIPALSASSWVLLILFGVFSTALPFIFYVESMRYIESQKASLILMLTVVTNPIAAFIFFREIPTIAALAGGALILLSSIMVLKSKE